MFSRDSVPCPHCGEEIRRDALSCRHCGSDAQTGWSEVADMNLGDLPDEGDYEEGLKREGFRPAKGGGKGWWMAATSLVLIALFLAWMLRGLW
jgi:hypothetical protein